MFDQLNRFMILLALCELLTQPAMAAPDGDQTLVVNGDTLVVQMAELLPTGYQTVVVDGDTLTVQVLSEPLPIEDPSSAVSDDSLSVQKRATEISPQVAVGDSASTTKEIDRHLIRSVFMGDFPRSASADSSAVERGRVTRVILKFGTGTLAAYYSIQGGARLTADESSDLSGVIGAALGAAVGYLGAVPAVVTLWDPYDDPDRLVLASFLGGLGSLALPSTWRLWGIYVGSPALATIASEWSRKPPKDTSDRRVSLALMPDSRGYLSAVATLRF